MARAQQGGVSAVTIGMIVFAGLWLATTVVLVILYTDQEELQKAKDSAVAAKLKAVSDQQERNIPLLTDARETGPTMVGLIEAERQATAKVSSGDGTMYAAALRQRRDALVERVRNADFVASPSSYDTNMPLVDIASRLADEARNKQGELQEAQRTVDKLTQEVERHIREKGEQQSEFDRRARDYRDRLAEFEADRDTFRAKHDEAVQKVERTVEERRQQDAQALAAARNDVKEAEDQLALLRERLNVLESKFGDVMIQPTPLATARQPDGEVLRAAAGDDVVYINLGQQDRLTLGLQFAVYDYETGIPADGRSKGRIEVISIFDSSAECRIVQTNGNEVIFENDLIANPIYDKHRAPTFLILGEFDLNNDSVIDDEGSASIKALVTEWGGTVSEELTALTDFVVLGLAPPRPSRAVGDADTPEQASQIELAKQRYDRYSETVEQARDLSVPVMTQNVFLQFLGYASSQR